MGEVKKKKNLELSGDSYFGKVRETSYLNFDRGSSDFQVGFLRRVSVRLYALAGFQAEKEISVSGALAAMTQRSSYMSSLFEKQKKKKKKQQVSHRFFLKHLEVGAGSGPYWYMQVIKKFTWQ